MKKFLAALLMITATTCYGQGIPVLEYHNIVRPSDNVPASDMAVYVDTFNAQMKWLHDNNYTTITSAELVQYMNGKFKISNPNKTVVISFDDGYANQLNAVPALDQYGFRGTFSIIASYPGSPDYMNWNQIRTLVKTGHDIESHSMTHPENIQVAYYYTEIAMSKAIIEQQIGKPVTVMTWPNGKFNAEMITVARDANYLGALTIDQDWCMVANQDISAQGHKCERAAGNAIGQNSFFMKRFFIDGRCTAAEIGKEIEVGHTIECAKH